MALEFQNLWFDKVNDPAFIMPLARDQLQRVGVNTTDLPSYGYLEYWRDTPERPGTYYTLTVGNRAEANDRVEQVDTWTEMSAEQKRGRISGDIDAQVLDGSARQLVEDPSLQRTIETTSGGAAARKSDLEDTDDAGLDAFDPTIIPTPFSGSGYVEARLICWIDIVDPWAGAPNAIYALRVNMEIINGDGSEGAEARAAMFGPSDGPAGAVMAFTQDGTNPLIWESQTQEGRYWEDPETEASVRIYWGNGSIPVSGMINVPGYGYENRTSTVVRYGASL